MRKSTVKRKTKETNIEVEIQLDGSGKSEISTGIGFLDHMLDQLSKHSLIDIKLRAKGDLHVDYHHTTEDSAIALGEAFDKALGDKKGITRFGQALSAMDETLSRIVVDCSNRPHLAWRVKILNQKLVKWIQNCLKNGFKHFLKQLELHYTLKTCMEKIHTISLNLVLKD